MTDNLIKIAIAVFEPVILMATIVYAILSWGFIQIGTMLSAGDFSNGKTDVYENSE